MMPFEATLLKLWAQCLLECCSLGVNWLLLLLLHIPGILGEGVPLGLRDPAVRGVRSVGRFCGDFKGCLVFQKLSTGILLKRQDGNPFKMPIEYLKIRQVITMSI